jgi:hypothetical protein
MSASKIANVEEIIRANTQSADDEWEQAAENLSKLDIKSTNTKKATKQKPPVKILKHNMSPDSIGATHSVVTHPQIDK